MTIRSLRSIVAGSAPITGSRVTTVLDAALLMKKTGKGALLILEDRKLVGIFTERDALFRVIAARRDPNTTTMSDVMTPHPQTIHPDEPFLNAMRVMHEGGFRHVPVVRNGHPVGMVSARDALSLEWDELALELGRRQQIGESLG